MNYLLVAASILVLTSSCKKKDDDVKPSPVILYQDKLVTDNDTWYKLNTNDYILEFAQGGYSIVSNVAGYFYSSRAPYNLSASPYILQVDVTTILQDVSKSGYVGFFFNSSSNTNYSVFCIYTDGKYGIWKYDGAYTTVISPTYSAAIRKGSGSKNTIRLAQNKTHVNVQVNNQNLGTYALALPPTMNSAGLMVGAMNLNYGFTQVRGVFNNFVIKTNP